VQVWQTSNLRRLRRGEEKRKKKKKPRDENIMVCPIPYGDHNKSSAIAKMSSATVVTIDMGRKVERACCAPFGESWHSI